MLTTANLQIMQVQILTFRLILSLRGGTSSWPFVKIPKFRSNLFIVRRAIRTVPIPQQRVDTLVGIDVPPAARMLLSICLKSVPVSTLSRLIHTWLAWMIDGGVERGVIRETLDILEQSIETVHQMPE